MGGLYYALLSNYNYSSSHVIRLVSFGQVLEAVTIESLAKSSTSNLASVYCISTSFARKVKYSHTRTNYKPIFLNQSTIFTQSKHLQLDCTNI